MSHTKKIESIVFALPILGHPRHAKRISMLIQSGFKVEAIAFERDYHQGRLPDCTVTKLGKIKSGYYLRRTFIFLKSLFIIRRAIIRNDAVYAFGADMALAVVIAGIGLNRPVIFEVGDLRGIETKKNLAGVLVRLLVRFTANSSKLLVATTSGFIDEYYRKWLNVTTPALIIENKLENDSFTSIPKEMYETKKGLPLIDRPLRIGYFGILRDSWSLDVLEKLALTYPEKIEIIFAGLPADNINIAELANKIKNIEFLGTYESPQDLPMLYGNVDMVWACYPPFKPDDWNFRLARPNRFYESCFFKKPTFTRSGSQDAIDVHNYNIGFIIDDSDYDDVIKHINGIDFDDVDSWIKNMFKLKENIYMYTNEAENLSSSIRKLQ